jgi:hypothetical protein
VAGAAATHLSATRRPAVTVKALSKSVFPSTRLPPAACRLLTLMSARMYDRGSGRYGSQTRRTIVILDDELTRGAVLAVVALLATGLLNVQPEPGFSAIFDGCETKGLNAAGVRLRA